MRPAGSEFESDYFFFAALIPQSLQSFFSAFLTSQHFFFSAAGFTAQHAFLGAAFAAGFVWAITLVLITAIAKASIKFFMFFLSSGTCLIQGCRHLTMSLLNRISAELRE